jgi:hypothetical protein
MPDNSIVMPAESRNGEYGSLYINETGKHRRNVNVSIRRMVLSILKISNGLISFMGIGKSSECKYNQN